MDGIIIDTTNFMIGEVELESRGMGGAITDDLPNMVIESYTVERGTT